MGNIWVSRQVVYVPVGGLCVPSVGTDRVGNIGVRKTSCLCGDITVKHTYTVAKAVLQSACVSVANIDQVIQGLNEALRGN